MYNIVLSLRQDEKTLFNYRKQLHVHNVVFNSCFLYRAHPHIQRLTTFKHSMDPRRQQFVFIHHEVASSAASQFDDWHMYLFSSYFLLLMVSSIARTILIFEIMYMYMYQLRNSETTRFLFLFTPLLHAQWVNWFSYYNSKTISVWLYAAGRQYPVHVRGWP